ncbi:MAG: 3-dehydroquinate synthase [Candidatus Latescibacteria bacterium]|nr:3-dehydroquinate synthase [Candidatus Latescibacterota bacterium]
MEKNIFLLGFMGSGKTRVGQSLARKLSRDFIDTDQLVEQKAGKTISQIFAQQGEEEFRRLEQLCIREASERKSAVISLGGGAPCYAENRKIVQHGISVYISASPEVILHRVRRNNRRPLLAGLSDTEKLEKIKALLARREKFYQQADIVVQTETEGSPEEVADKIIEKLRGILLQIMRVVNVDLEERSYPIYIGTGVLSEIGELCRRHSLGERLAVVTNPTVAEFYLSPVEQSLADSGFEVLPVFIPDGEQYKTLETADRIFESLIGAKLGRDSAIIALGGGVVGDIAGFVAATFLRGIRYIQVPTTLLAQVDSSVGGKVAVNHRLGKNLIGAFHQPKFVLIDTRVLRTLPKRELRAGMVEVVKHSLIRDADLFQRLESNMERLLELTVPPGFLQELVARNCEIKAEVVSKDEREQGLRTILNYGHTVGHAIEALTDYRCYRHGEAVLLGMIVAGHIASQMELLPEEQKNRQNRLLERLGFPPSPSAIPTQAIMEKIESDKKVRGGRLRFVLLHRIGEAAVSEQVGQRQIEEGVKYLHQTLRGMR